MIYCCAHCEQPIPWDYDDNIFCSDECGDAFTAEMLADAEGDDW